MADVKFSELSTLAATALAAADVLAIVDSSESASKQLSIDNLFGAVPVNIAVTDITDSTSNTTGSITTTGGIGVVGSVFVGEDLDVDGITNLDVVDIDGAVDITAAVQLTGALTVGVDGTGHDVQIFGDTADSTLLWDQSADALEFGNSFITINDARTTGTVDVRGLTIDVSNKVDTGSSNDRIGIDCDVIGDVNGNTIRDAVAIRAVSRQSTGAEVTRLNTPIHSVLDMANTASANNTGTTLSGAYGLAIDHDDTIATRTGQPTAFISFGELYVGGSVTYETAYLFDIFPQGKTGDATYGTSADVAFYNDGAQYATTKDTMLLEAATSASVTFIVTVATGINLNGASGNIYLIDGVARPVLALQGNTLYRFDYSDSSVNTHIVQFSLTSNGTHSGGYEITAGVTHVGTAGQAGAYVEFLTPNTNSTYYYYCGNHSYMGNTINITAIDAEVGHRLMMENDPFDSIQMEDDFMIETEDGEAILLETQDNVGTASTILFETGSQDADGVLKIRVNGEDKYIQLYNTPGTSVY